jgi:hypothetical protein
VVHVHLPVSSRCGEGQHDRIITPPRESFEPPPERDGTGRKKLRHAQRQLVVAPRDVVLPLAWHPELLTTEQVGEIQRRQVAGVRAIVAGERDVEDGAEGRPGPARHA